MPERAPLPPSPSFLPRVWTLVVLVSACNIGISILCSLQRLVVVVVVRRSRLERKDSSLALLPAEQRACTVSCAVAVQPPLVPLSPRKPILRLEAVLRLAWPALPPSSRSSRSSRQRFLRPTPS